MTSGGLIILLVISLQWYLQSNNTPKELKTIKTHLFSSNFTFTTTFCVFVAVVIYCLSNVSSSVTSYITGLFRKRFDQALLSDFLRNLLHLIVVPQLQWNLICLKWVEILEHNI